MTLTAPAVPAGVSQVMVVAELAMTFAAALPSNMTLVAPVKSVPVRVTAWPPAVGPTAGDTFVRVGTGITYVKRVFAAFEPAGVVTTTLTAPAACAGVVQVMLVADTTATAVAAVPPKVTPVAP